MISPPSGATRHIKAELRRIAESIKAGERARIPMGLLFVGPMGTGKTFVADAFVRESGLSAVKLKNFRSKWVGSTEANLEKVLSLVRLARARSFSSSMRAIARSAAVAKRTAGPPRASSRA